MENYIQQMVIDVCCLVGLDVVNVHLLQLVTNVSTVLTTSI